MSTSSDTVEPASGRPSQSTARRPNLDLRIPEQAPPPADSFLLDPKESREWLEALPLANVGATARELFNALGDFNRMEIPELLRVRIVEQFRDPIEYVVERLRRHFVDMGFPLHSKSRKAATLAKEFQAELAISYKIIVRQMLEGKSARFDRKLLVIALHRAMYYLSKVLCHAALIYRPWPPNVWREIHSIYAYAAQNRIHTAPVKDPLQPDKAPTSIEQLYKTALLFAVSTPQRLRQSQICLLMDHESNWADMIDLRMLDKHDRPLGLYHVDLWTDEPPHNDRLRPPQVGQRGRAFDLRKLINQVNNILDFEGEVAESTTYSANGKPSTAMLRRLLKNWEQGPGRRPVRTRLNFELQVVSGLNRIHRCMQAADLAAAVPEPAVEQDPYITSNAINAPDPDIWLGSSNNQLSLSPMAGISAEDSLFQDSTSLLSSHTELTEHSKPGWTAGENSEAEDHTWQVKTLSESANGYCIEWPGRDIPPVKIGELIGVQSAADAQQFGLGVVRWMSQPHKAPLELGIEMFSPACRRALSSTGGKSGEQAELRCLLIPASGNKHDFTEVLLEAANLAEGTELKVTFDNGSKQTLRILRLVEVTGAFRRYACQSLVNNDRDGGTDGESDGGYEDLWSSL